MKDVIVIAVRNLVIINKYIKIIARIDFIVKYFLERLIRESTLNFWKEGEL